MKTLKAFGEELEAETVFKTEDSVVGYIEGREVFRFSGIRTFSHFELLGEWDETPVTDAEKLAALEQENNQLRQNVDFLEGVVMEMAMNTLE